LIDGGVASIMSMKIRNIPALFGRRVTRSLLFKRPSLPLSPRICLLRKVSDIGFVLSDYGTLVRRVKSSLTKSGARKCSERSPEGAKYLSPGRSPGERVALTPPSAPLSRRPAARRTCARSPMGTALWAAGRAGEGKGERERASTHPAQRDRGLHYVAPSELNSGAEFLNELLTHDASVYFQ